MGKLCTVTLPIFQGGLQAITRDNPQREQFPQGLRPYTNGLYPKTAEEKKRKYQKDGSEECQTVPHNMSHK